MYGSVQGAHDEHDSVVVNLESTMLASIEIRRKKRLVAYLFLEPKAMRELARLMDDGALLVEKAREAKKQEIAEYMATKEQHP